MLWAFDGYRDPAVCCGLTGSSLLLLFLQVAGTPVVAEQTQPEGSENVLQLRVQVITSMEQVSNSLSRRLFLQLAVQEQQWPVVE